MTVLVALADEVALAWFLARGVMRLLIPVRLAPVVLVVPVRALRALA